MNRSASYGMVRKAHLLKMFIKKGYHVTEACVLTTGNHPVSIFSKVHSSAEKGYKSTNTVTFEAMNEVRLFLKKQASLSQ